MQIHSESKLFKFDQTISNIYMEKTVQESLPKWRSRMRKDLFLSDIKFYTEKKPIN